jgi:lipopolysaccharide/colanic/teichoic acid biosynthesis glycosyltransferase
MSLVGPRPLANYEARRVPHWARRRYTVQPGQTCYWQVMGRNKLTFEEWMRLDLRYIDDWSLGLDLRLLLRTPWALVAGRGAY